MRCVVDRCYKILLHFIRFCQSGFFCSYSRFFYDLVSEVFLYTRYNTVQVFLFFFFFGYIISFACCFFLCVCVSVFVFIEVKNELFLYCFLFTVYICMCFFLFCSCIRNGLLKKWLFMRTFL